MDQTVSFQAPSSNALLSQAREAQGAGHPERARALLETLLAQHPDHAQALNMLGLILLACQKIEHGREMLRRATEADPQAAALWLNLAQACRQLQDDAAELESLTNALDRDPYLLIAHVRKAEVHDRLGQEADAVREWQAVLMIGDRDAQPSANLTQLLRRARSYIEPRANRMASRLEIGLQSARKGRAKDDIFRFDAAVDHALGQRKIYSSQSSGLHFPFLPADEFFPRRFFPWLSELEAATDNIRRELEAALQRDRTVFAPYVDQASGAAENIWSDLSRSSRWSAYYLWRYGVRNDAACLQCPATTKVIEALPCADQPDRAPTAFFSLLTAGTRIPPHTGVSNTRAIVHLPLIVPPRCGFRVGGQTREWHVGEAFVFDDTIEHEAWNDSEEQRAILIFDVWNPYLTATERDLLRAFYASADSAGLTPGGAASFGGVGSA